MIDPKYLLYDDSSDPEVTEIEEDTQAEVGNVSVSSLSVLDPQDEVKTHEYEYEFEAVVDTNSHSDSNIHDSTLDPGFLSPSLNSVSSVSSTRKLEWDSGADVGYAEKTPAGISTIERMVLGSSASLHCSTSATSETISSAQVSDTKRHLNYSNPSRSSTNLSNLMWRLSFEESLAEVDENPSPRPNLTSNPISVPKSHSLDSLNARRKRNSFQNQSRSYSQDFGPEMMPSHCKIGTTESSSGSQATVVYNSPSRKLDFTAKLPDCHSQHSEEHLEAQIIPVTTYRSSSTEQEDKQAQTLDSKSSDFVYYPGHTFQGRPKSQLSLLQSTNLSPNEPSPTPQSGRTSAMTSSTRKTDVEAELQVHRQLRDHLQCLNAYLHRLEETYKLSTRPDLRKRPLSSKVEYYNERCTSEMSKSSKSSIARLPAKLHIPEPNKHEPKPEQCKPNQSKPAKLTQNTYTKVSATAHSQNIPPKSNGQTQIAIEKLPVKQNLPKSFAGLQNSAPATLMSQKPNNDMKRDKSIAIKSASPKTNANPSLKRVNPKVVAKSQASSCVGTRRGNLGAKTQTTAVQTTDSLSRNNNSFGEVNKRNFTTSKPKAFLVSLTDVNGASDKTVATLQAALRCKRPDFIARAEARCKFLRFARDMRILKSELRQEKMAQFVVNSRPVPPLSPLKIPRLFTTKELKQQTAKWVTNPCPSQYHLCEVKKQRRIQTNQAMAKMYHKKLQHQVLKGHVTINHSTSVLAL